MGTANTVPPVIQSGPGAGNPNHILATFQPGCVSSPECANTRRCALQPVAGNLGASVSGPCYLPTTGLGATMPGTNGGQRQIQFAVRFMF